MDENRRTMVMLGTYASFLLLVLHVPTFVGSTMQGLTGKTLAAHQSIRPVEHRPVTGSGPRVESSKINLDAARSGTPHKPESPPSASRHEAGRESSKYGPLVGATQRQQRAHYCLALNVYWEARNQSVSGQLAVAQVTLNRARDSRYPNDVCEVVFDHHQFSWYWDGLSDYPSEISAWENALLVASAAMHGSGHADLDHVTHYHAVYSQPYWKDSMTLVATIGDHLFYMDQ